MDFLPETRVNSSNIQVETYGKMPDGREVKIFTLTNRQGLKAKVMEYGAILISMETPDREGTFADLTHGYDRLEDWLEDSAYFGVTTGRFANRIGHARFSLDGVDYPLAENNGPHHLHGGPTGFHKRLWKGEVTDDGVVLTYLSEDGEEGYPGNLEVRVVYSLTDSDELKWQVTATTDRATIVNVVNHTYWNLSGDPQKVIREHELAIEADHFLPTDEGMIPQGEIRPVSGTPMDFTEPTPIGAQIDEDFDALHFGMGYDSCWVLRKADGVRLAARVVDPQSGRVMEMFTDQPGIQFFTGNILDGSRVGKGGIAYPKQSAFCLETQAFPDAPNRPEFPSVVLRPGEIYRHTLIHRFSAL
jgi:aldose 1-epimerase